MISCVYNIIPRVTSNKVIQIGTLKNTINKPKWNSKKKKVQVTHMKTGERKQRNNHTNKWRNRKPKKKAITDSSPDIAIITLNVNGINTPV